MKIENFMAVSHFELEPDYESPLIIRPEILFILFNDLVTEMIELLAYTWEN